MTFVRVKYAVVLSLLLALPPLSFGQWNRTAGPGGGSVSAFTVNGSNIVAGTLGGGAFLSTNSAGSWSAINSGLPKDLWVYALTNDGTRLYAGTLDGRIFRSGNNGAGWTPSDSSLPAAPILSLYANNSLIFAGISKLGVFVSNDTGSHWSWSAVNIAQLDSANIYGFAVNGSNTFAAGDSGVFVTANNGATWAATGTQPAKPVYALAMSGSNLVEASATSVAYSSNNGGLWTTVGSFTHNMLSLAASGSYVFAGTDSTVFVSSNNGASFSTSTGLPVDRVVSLTVSGSTILAGTVNSGVFASTDNGSTWTAANTGLAATKVHALAAIGSLLFAGTQSRGGIARSLDSGATWTPLSSGLQADAGDIPAMTANGSALFAGTLKNGIYRSLDSGASWAAANSGLTYDSAITSFALNGSTLYAGTAGRGVFLSTDNGSTWTALNTGLSAANVQALLQTGSGLYAGTRGGVFFYANGSWGAINSGLSGSNLAVNKLVHNGSNVFAGTDSGVYIYNGSSWSPAFSGLGNLYIQSLATSGFNLFAGTSGGGVSVSANNGTSWTPLDSAGLTNTTAMALLRRGTVLYEGTKAGGIWKDNISAYVTYPSAPSLATPSSGASGQSTTPTLTWGTVSGATGYGVQVSTAADFSSTVLSQTGLTAASTVSGTLGYNATYYWRANASNSGGISDWSASWSFTTQPAVPPAPVLSSPTNNASNLAPALSLQWNSAATALSYDVMVSTASNFGTTVQSVTGLTATSLALSNLNYGTNYYWEVNGTNLAGTGSWSTAWSFATQGVPPAPVLSSPTNNSANLALSLTLQWNSAATALSYGILVSTAADFGSTVQSITGLSATSLALSDLVNGTTCYWKVNATSDAGTGAWSTVWSFGTVPLPPATPVLSSPSDGATSQPVILSLMWNTVSWASGYAIQVTTASDFSTTVYSYAGLTASFKVPPELTPLANWFWRVQATGPGGSSSWSNGWGFVTGAAAPDLSMPADGSTLLPVALTLQWNSMSGATSYGVQVSTASSFATTVLLQTGLSSTAAAVNLASGTPYYWRANTAYASQTSSWSTVWSFTTITNCQVPLSRGWNMISFNVILADSNAQTIFGDSASHVNQHYPRGFILIKNLFGQVYCPSQGIIDPMVIHTGTGLQMYTDSTDTVHTGGSAVPLASTPVPVIKGWNLIGYLPAVAVPVNTALSGITSIIQLVKNNGGLIYWPDYGINDIGSMVPGQGYFMYTKSAGALTYVLSKRLAAGGTLLSLPLPHHFTLHANTGSSASVLAYPVVCGTHAAAEGSELAAFDHSGNCVGAGSVIQGKTAFAVWGDDITTKAKDGCSEAEPLTFKLWDGSREYPVDFSGANGSPAQYTTQGILAAGFRVPEEAFITAFDLSRAWPNPFRGSINIAFDVPRIGTESGHAVEINIYNVNGVLIQQLAKGSYKPGRYTVSWHAAAVRSNGTGPGMYIIRMKAQNFDKRMKVICVR